jgi:hypothetical protein
MPDDDEIDWSQKREGMDHFDFMLKWYGERITPEEREANRREQQAEQDRRREEEERRIAHDADAKRRDAERDVERQAEAAAIRAWVASCPVDADHVFEAYPRRQRDHWNDVDVPHYASRRPLTLSRLRRDAGQTLCGAYRAGQYDTPGEQHRLRKLAGCRRCMDIASRYGLDLTHWRPVT